MLTLTTRFPDEFVPQDTVPLTPIPKPMLTLTLSNLPNMSDGDEAFVRNTPAPYEAATPTTNESGGLPQNAPAVPNTSPPLYDKGTISSLFTSPNPPILVFATN